MGLLLAAAPEEAEGVEVGDTEGVGENEGGGEALEVTVTEPLTVGVPLLLKEIDPVLLSLPPALFVAVGVEVRVRVSEELAEQLPVGLLVALPEGVIVGLGVGAAVIVGLVVAEGEALAVKVALGVALAVAVAVMGLGEELPSQVPEMTTLSIRKVLPVKL